MRKLLVCAFALGGFAASAQAADLGLDSMKDPLPDTLTYQGITIYGTVDVGYAYQTHGVPISGSLATGLEDSIWGSRNANKAISSLSDNGLSQSTIGVKIEEAIGMGWTALGKIETGFVPTSGMLADGCASLVMNNGKTYAQQNANGDSSRCGQAFNGEVYAGVSNAAYGTLTVGRQNSLALATAANYDPMALSYAFSILGYTGTGDGGSGVTELSRWDNSIKYAYQYGPIHAAAMYSDGGSETSMYSGGYAGNLGFTWRGLSVDGVYTIERGADGVAAPIPAPSMAASGITCIAGSTGATACPNGLLATASDNTSYQINGKYVWELGGGYKDGGYKDDFVSNAKVTFYGGYVHTQLADPNTPVPVGTQTEGGYTMLAVNNAAYATDKILQTAWAGVKYETGPWAFTGAYYHINQNSYLTSAAAETCATLTAANVTHQAAGTFPAGARTIGANCSGDFDQVSFLVDYTFNKHFDVYAGVSYSEISGGLSSAYLQDNNTLFMTGMRLKF